MGNEQSSAGRRDGGSQGPPPPNDPAHGDSSPSAEEVDEQRRIEAARALVLLSQADWQLREERLRREARERAPEPEEAQPRSGDDQAVDGEVEHNQVADEQSQEQAPEDQQLANEASISKKANKKNAAKKPSKNQRSGDVADKNGALLVHSTGWRVGHPKPQNSAQGLGPSYHVPRGPPGGATELYNIKWPVDFTSSTSVNKANKRRRVASYRWRQKYGFPELRPPTAHRTFTAANRDWLLKTIRDWAKKHGGVRPSQYDLEDLYNEEFDGDDEQRSAASIMSYIGRQAALKAEINKYAKNPPAKKPRKKPSEDKPVEDDTINETPLDERPADEQPPHDHPVEEEPAAHEPISDTPAPDEAFPFRQILPTLGAQQLLQDSDFAGAPQDQDDEEPVAPRRRPDRRQELAEWQARRDRELYGLPEEDDEYTGYFLPDGTRERRRRPPM